MTLRTPIDINKQVLYLYNDTDRTDTIGIFNEDRSEFDLYETETGEFIDSYRSIATREFTSATYNKDDLIVRGVYYGEYTHTRLWFKEHCPFLDGWSFEELDDLYIYYTVSQSVPKRFSRAGVPTERMQHRINDRNLQSAPFVHAAQSDSLWVIRDPENYLGRLQIHHIDGDGGNDTADNLIAVPTAAHHKIHKNIENGSVFYTASLVNALRGVTKGYVSELLFSTARLKEWLERNTLSYQNAYYQTARADILRFIDEDNENYNIYDSVWDNYTERDSERLSLLTDMQWIMTVRDNPDEFRAAKRLFKERLENTRHLYRL